MQYVNVALVVVVLAVTLFALGVACDPKLAKWLASVVYSRAVAVQAAREAYNVARRSRLELGRVLEAQKNA